MTKVAIFKDTEIYNSKNIVAVLAFKHIALAFYVLLSLLLLLLKALYNHTGVFSFAG